MFKASVSALKHRLGIDRVHAVTDHFIAVGQRNYHVLPRRIHDLWPYWIFQTHLPTCPHFIPTDLTGLLLNTRYRNWTGLSAPGLDAVAVIDPRGLITPPSGGWSVDVWIHHDGQTQSTASLTPTEHTLDPHTGLLRTVFNHDGLLLSNASQVVLSEDGQAVLLTTLSVQNTADTPISFALVPAIRPCNPEGISPIRTLQYLSGQAFVVNGKLGVVLDTQPDNVVCLAATDQPAHLQIGRWEMILSATCPHELATAFAEYRRTLAPETTCDFTLRFPLEIAARSGHVSQDVQTLRVLPDAACRNLASQRWGNLLKTSLPSGLSNPRLRTVFEQSLHHLLGALASDRIVAGPLVYTQMETEDAAFCLTALIRAGYFSLVDSFLDRLFSPEKGGQIPLYMQNTVHGGQWLWVLHTLCRDRPDLHAKWQTLMLRIAKQLPVISENQPMADQLWSLAGLQYGILTATEEKNRQVLQKRSTLLKHRIWGKLDHFFATQPGESPTLISEWSSPRDGDLIRALIAAWPLNLLSFEDIHIRNTIDYIRNHHMVDRAFFKSTPPSGFSPHLQALFGIVAQDSSTLETMLNWVSPTGAWPQAVHPETLSGCGGEGHYYLANAMFIHGVLSLYGS